MAEKPYHFEAKVSYTTEENAEVVCSTLAVDPEVSETISPAPAACALPPPHVRACVCSIDIHPIRSVQLHPECVERSVTRDGKQVIVRFQAVDPRTLRAASGTFMDLLKLASDMVETFGKGSKYDETS